MKIHLEVTHSCTIKRKKPWPKLSWIGKEKEQLFILDNHRISILDPNTGKTKRKVSKIKQYLKTIVAYNISDNGYYFIAILTNGDLIIWNKDKNFVKSVAGLAEFALKINNCLPHVFVSDDARKIILITSINRVYVWESDRSGNENNQDLIGNWSHVVPSKDIKFVENSKELVVHARFNTNHIEGISATCCFVFNCENKIYIITLKLRWINPNEIFYTNQTRFETIWFSHQPSIQKQKFTCLYTRGAYVAKLSHNTNLLALGVNQKQTENTCLVFFSPTNGLYQHVDLKNFGLNPNSKGRNYWLQDLCWLYNDLYLCGITKHGALFICSRLGQTLFIHAIGKEINMGPALFLTLHPLIIVRGNHNSSLLTNGSLNSNLENEDSDKQRYSLARHPNLPILACSDGFLLCILKIETCFSTQSRLIREMVHETIGLLNSIENNKNPIELKRKVLIQNEDNIPDWGLHTNNHSEPTSDSGMESNNEKFKSKQKLADGKIIFSFLPQILPLSFETIETQSLEKKLELSYENLISSWALLTSLDTYQASLNINECDQTCLAILESFKHFAQLVLKLDTKNFNFLKQQEEFKLKSLIELFLKMFKLLNFDPSSKLNPSSHMLSYISNLTETFIQSVLKNKKIDSNRLDLLELIYTLLNLSEKLIKSIYQFKTNDQFMIVSTECKKSLEELQLNNTTNNNNGNANNTEYSQEEKKSDSDKIETDSLEKSYSLIVKSNKKQYLSVFDLMFEKCWFNLFHYTVKYRRTLLTLGSNEIDNLDKFIILLQRHVFKFSLKNPILKKNQKNFKLSKPEMIYLNYGDFDTAVSLWQSQMESSKNPVRIGLQILYSCIENYKISTLTDIIEIYLKNSGFSLKKNLFESIKQFYKIKEPINTMLKSLARFIANYLLDKQLYVPSISNPIEYPSLFEASFAPDLNKIEINKNKLNLLLKEEHVANLFNLNKLMEIFFVTNLFNEAVLFLNLINDWKSSFLISSIIKDSAYKLNTGDSTSLLILKFKNLLNFNINNLDFNLMEKSYLNNLNLILRELLKCSVLTKSNVLEDLLTSLMQSLVLSIQELTSSSFLITEQFYLPAPPIYCAQIDHQQDLHESKLRIKICLILKCIIMLVSSSNLIVPMMKWYLEKLVESAKQMTDKYGIENTFELNLSLRNLLTGTRYQKIGYIPEQYFFMFRDLCSVLFFMDLRDKLCIQLRNFSKYLELNFKKYFDTGLKIIDYGLLILNFRSFLNKSDLENLEDIVISTISKLSKHVTNLEAKLALLVEKKSSIESSSQNEFNIKLQCLLDEWKMVNLNDGLNMADNYKHKILINQKSVNSKLQSLYGLNECTIERIYVQKMTRTEPSQVGGYELERSRLYVEFLEFFFKFGFDNSENWDSVFASVNQTPLLPEFYEQFRKSELPEHLDRQCLIQIKYRAKKESNVSTKPVQNEVKLKKGLFRSYSMKNVLDNNENALKKSKSWLHIEDLRKEIKKEENLIDNDFKVYYLGAEYNQVSKVAIWLIGWSQNLQKLLINNSKLLNLFQKSSEQNKIVLKLKNLNSNFLLSVCYLADYLNGSTRMKDDEFTHVTLSSDNKQQQEEASELSDSTLDISSYSVEEAKIMEKEEQKINKEESFINQALDVTEYYDFENLEKKSVSIKQESKNEESLKQTSASEVLVNLFKPKSSSPSRSISPIKKTVSVSTEVSKSFIKSRSVSPINKSLITENKPSSEVLASLKTSRSVSPIKQLLVLENKAQQNLEEKFYDKSITPEGDIHQLIRNELKKIVQMQHNTVMNYLNHGSQVESYAQSDDLNQRLMTVLKQSKFDSEFVIETKIKPASKASAAEESITQSCFIKTFEKREQVNEARVVVVETQKKSSLIKIPLLNIQKKNEANNNNNNETKNVQKNSNFNLINLPNVNTKEVSKSNKKLELLNLNNETKTTETRVYKNKNFKLLRLDLNSQETEAKSIEIRKLEKTTSIDSNLQQNEKSQKSIQTSFVSEDKAKNVEIQVQKPLYDGYILAPDVYKDLFNQQNEQQSTSVAQAHYDATKHLRNETKLVPNKKDIYTNTDTLSNSDPIPPNILFKIKFDSNKKDREISSEVNSNDYLNIADLNNHDVDDILKLIESEQQKRDGKYVDLKKKSPPLIESADKNEKSLNKTDSIELVLQADRVTQDVLLNQEANKQKYELDLEELIEQEHRPDINKIGVITELKYIDEKIKEMNKMADLMVDDCSKLDKFVDKLDSIGSQREQLENLIIQQSDAEKETKKEDKEVKFYKPEEAASQLKHFKSRQIKTKSSDLIIEILNEAEDLSDLRDSEESKLKQILENPKPRINGIKIEPIENQNTKRRVTITEKFTSIREKEAKNLLKELKSESDLFLTKQKQIQNRPKSKSPSNSLRLSRSSQNISIPLLELSKPELDLVSVEMNFRNKQPSSMAKTILSLNKKEKQRQSETSRVLKELENRADLINMNNNNNTKIEKKTIKSFTNMVKLQDPGKLKHRTNNKSISYTEQLMKHQKRDIELNLDENEIKKIYGSHRVKGIYQPYVKQDERKVKPYSERLKDLKPKSSQVIISNRIKTENGIKTIKKDTRHDLNTKPKIKVKKVKRFTPYFNKIEEYEFENENDENLENLLKWSADDKIKSILYNKPNMKETYQHKKIKKTRDVDEDTLADLDFDMNCLMDEDEENEKIKNILKQTRSEEFVLDQEDYINQVDLDDLRNISLSSESAISSFIDWDLIDQMCDKFK